MATVTWASMFALSEQQHQIVCFFVLLSIYYELKAENIAAFAILNAPQPLSVMLQCTVCKSVQEQVNIWTTSPHNAFVPAVYIHSSGI